MADRLAKGTVDEYTSVSIYGDGTFTTKWLLGKESDPDRLLSFEYDIDSMRRKSTTGRGAAALATGGLSLMAGNNWGVVYVTVGGAETGVRSYSTRNPTGTHLTGIRKLKAAADLVTKANSSPATRAPSSDLVTQLERLAELHSAGVLTDDEFTTKKAELLDRL